MTRTPFARLVSPRGGVPVRSAVRILAVALCLLFGIAVGSVYLGSSSGKVGGVLLALEDETAALVVVGEIADRMLDRPDSGGDDGPPLSTNGNEDASETDGKGFGLTLLSENYAYDVEDRLFVPRTLFVGVASAEGHTLRPLRGPPAGG